MFLKYFLLLDILSILLLLRALLKFIIISTIFLFKFLSSLLHTFKTTLSWLAWFIIFAFYFSRIQNPFFYSLHYLFILLIYIIPILFASFSFMLLYYFYFLPIYYWLDRFIVIWLGGLSIIISISIWLILGLLLE